MNNATNPPTKNQIWTLLDELATKKGINEIAINNPNTVFIEKGGKFFLLDFKIAPAHLLEFVKEVAKFNGKECNEDNPILDGNLPDGSRINILHPPYVKPGPVITIRKYLSEIISFENSPGIFGLTPEWVTFIKAAIKSRMNILVAGGTGVGKTTFLNLILQEIPHEERVITIEDTRELHFKIPNLVCLESGQRKTYTDNFLSTRDLVKNTLRMRPDRIIIGEIRGGEIFDLLQAMNTGHDGSMTSIHANNPAESLKRMVSLYMLAGFEVPLKAIKGSISTAIQLIFQISRDREGKRVVSEIQEVTGMEGENILLQKLAEHSHEKGILEGTGIVPHCIKKLNEKSGLPLNFFQHSL